MNESKMNRSVRLIVRVTQVEMDKINNRSTASTCRTVSEYLRRVLFDKPITINQRNQSLDDFMAEMILLRYDLNSIENDFNKAVKQLNTLQKISEFKSWLLLYETTRKMLLEKVEVIKQKINSINDQWLQ